MDFLLAGKTEGVSSHNTMSTNTNTMSTKMTTCDCCKKDYDVSDLTEYYGEWLCSDCEEELGVKEGECPCPAEHEDDDEDCEKCGHKHFCEADHCEKCCRGKFCNCNDANCPYCKILRAYPVARTKSVKWWDNQI